MRASDFHLNANQILSAGTRLLAKLKSRGVESKNLENDDDAWVPFTDGVFLCQAVEVEKDLKPLLSHPSFPYPNRDENYLLSREKRPCLSRTGYVNVSYEDHFIAYRPAERTVNALHLLRLGNICRTVLAPHPVLAPRLVLTPHIILASHLILDSHPILTSHSILIMAYLKARHINTSLSLALIS